MANDPRGRVYDIEAQVSREPRIGRRMRYYQSAMDVSELGRGDGVAGLPESYIVFFCQRDPFGLALPSYTVERVCAEAPALDVGSGSHWLALNAQAWEAAACRHRARRGQAPREDAPGLHRRGRRVQPGGRARDARPRPRGRSRAARIWPRFSRRRSRLAGRRGPGHIRRPSCLVTVE